MIEKKSFFIENNQLNKGYRPEKHFNKHTPRKVDLPDSTILAEYEGMHPGAISKMMEMTSKEQQHRHDMEVIQSRMQATALRMGRLFAVFSILAICYTSFAMASNNMQNEAMVFAALGFSAMAISAYAGRGKKHSPHFNKKPFVHHKKPYQAKPISQGNTSTAAPTNAESGSTSTNAKPHYRRRKN